jgi:hypothetical protein
MLNKLILFINKRIIVLLSKIQYFSTLIVLSNLIEWLDACLKLLYCSAKSATVG